MGVGTRRKGSKVEWAVSIPETLAFRVESLCYDRGNQRPIYGFRSQLVSLLLEEWAARQEAAIASTLPALLPQPQEAAE